MIATVPPPLSRAELFSLLEKRIADPTILEEQERAIWAASGVERAVMVIDLSGFTRVTRRHGILRFLTVYRRACLAAVPSIAASGGRLVKCEADNVIATFAGPAEALAATREILARTTALDASLAPDDRVLVCTAVGFGRFLELTDDVYGDEVNVTFKLGEDVARAREILLTEGAQARLAAVGRAEPAEELAVETGGVHVRYFRLLSPCPHEP
jgi:class 3 adenylate cyclase